MYTSVELKPEVCLIPQCDCSTSSFIPDLQFTPSSVHIQPASSLPFSSSFTKQSRLHLHQIVSFCPLTQKSSSPAPVQQSAACDMYIDKTRYHRSRSSGKDFRPLHVLCWFMYVGSRIQLARLQSHGCHLSPPYSWRPHIAPLAQSSPSPADWPSQNGSDICEKAGGRVRIGR